MKLANGSVLKLGPSDVLLAGSRADPRALHLDTQLRRGQIGLEVLGRSDSWRRRTRETSTMALIAKAIVATEPGSLAAGRDIATKILRHFGEPPKALVVYLTVNHDQQAFLQGLSDILGAEPALIGCSIQGIIGRGLVREEGYGAGVLALGGDSIHVTQATVRNIASTPYESGVALGQALEMPSGTRSKLTLVLYDAVEGVDIEPFLAGIHSSNQCPMFGGAAAHAYFYSNVQDTFQYAGTEVLQNSAVALSIAGDFTMAYEICHGCAPVGVEMTVTRAEGNVLYELDGRRASDVWEEICGDIRGRGTNQSTALAIGVPSSPNTAEYLVRGAYLVDKHSGGVSLGPAIAAGTKIMLHHRTLEDVQAGAAAMAQRLKRQLQGKRVRAMLGYECGARTLPFLGMEGTLQENLMLQTELDQDAEWLTAVVWGELFPTAGRPGFHNYSHTLLAMAE